MFSQLGEPIKDVDESNNQTHCSRGPQLGLILLNNGDNSFSVAEGDVPGTEEARGVLVADFNGDNISDIYIPDIGFDDHPFNGAKNSLLLGTGTGFTNVSDRLPDIQAFTHDAATGDVDGDGDIDIFSLNADDAIEEQSYFLINDGAANFTLSRQGLPATLSNENISLLRTSFAAELSDLNNDGASELIVGRREGNLAATRIYWNDGAGNFSEADVTHLDDADVWGGLEKVAVIEIKGYDVNGDGLNDLVVSAYDQTTFRGISMQLFINKGNREFHDETLTRLGSLVQNPDPNLETPFFIQFIDVNNDGFADLLPIGMGGSSSPDNAVVLFEGARDGCFNAITMKNVTQDSDFRFVAGLRLPLVSQNELAFLPIRSETIDGTDIITVGWIISLSMQAIPPVANHYNACRGKIEVNLEYDGAVYALDFSIFSTSPDVVIQADQSSASVVTKSIENVATFTSSNGLLILPELVLDGVVAYRNLQFQLTDGEQLLFTLISFE